MHYRGNALPPPNNWKKILGIALTIIGLLIILMLMGVWVDSLYAQGEGKCEDGAPISHTAPDWWQGGWNDKHRHWIRRGGHTDYVQTWAPYPYPNTFDSCVVASSAIAEPDRSEPPRTPSTPVEPPTVEPPDPEPPKPPNPEPPQTIRRQYAFTIDKGIHEYCFPSEIAEDVLSAVLIHALKYHGDGAIPEKTDSGCWRIDSPGYINVTIFYDIPAAPPAPRVGKLATSWAKLKVR